MCRRAVTASAQSSHPMLLCGMTVFYPETFAASTNAAASGLKHALFRSANAEERLQYEIVETFGPASPARTAIPLTPSQYAVTATVSVVCEASPSKTQYFHTAPAMLTPS